MKEGLLPPVLAQSQYCDLEVRSLPSPSFSGENRARDHLRSIVQLWPVNIRYCIGAWRSIEHGLCFEHFAGMILSNLHLISGSWVPFSLVLPPLLPFKGNGDFERLNTLLRVIQIWVGLGVYSHSDFKAHCFIIYILYSQAVSEASREKLVFPTEVNVSTTVALGFLRPSCKNWILEYEG